VIYCFLLFAGLALLGAIYLSHSGFAALKQSNLDTRVTKWLTAMNVLLALLFAPAAIVLHFRTKYYYPPAVSNLEWLFPGLGGPILFFVIVVFFIKLLPSFCSYPKKFWFTFTASAILFGWSAWFLLVFLFLTFVN